MNDEVEKIAIKLNELIEYQIANRKNDSNYEARLDSFIHNFDYMLEEARETLEDFRSQGLSLNTIESEGYLRAFLTIQSILPTID